MTDEREVAASRPGLRTQAVHAGADADRPYGAIAAPIVQTSTYTFRDTAELRAHMTGVSERMEYGRYGNPTQRAVEQKLAALDAADDALVCASGMAAVTTTLLTLLRQGQHAILTDDCYRRTRQFCRQVLGKLGIEHTVVPTDDVTAIEAAIRPSTRVLLTESPTNPYLKVVDLPAIAALKTRGRYFKLIVDATFATPVNQQPMRQGADLVIHSATKYLGGHHDLLAGVVTGHAPLIAGIREMQGILGGVLDPHAAWLLMRGLKTLPLRVAAQNHTALTLARCLSDHPKVARVFYPGLPSHPSHAIARELMSGFGGVVSFTLHSDLAGGSRLVDATQIFQIGPSLGGTESLIEQVALMSFFELTTEEREAIGISDTLIRVAVGLEDADDLEADLLRGLDAV